MPAPYSLDLRRKIMDAYQRGEGSAKKMAARFSVSRNFVDRLIQRYRQTQSVAPKPRGGGNPLAFSAPQEEVLQQTLREYPDATLAELRDRTGMSCSLETISQTLKRLNLTRKKRA